MPDSLVEPTEAGLYCEPANAYLDPSQPVDNAVVSHAHADHGAKDSERIHCTPATQGLLKARYGFEAQSHSFEQRFAINGVEFIFHPASHVLGSALVSVIADDEHWVYTGDYKRREDPTTTSLSIPSCDVFITESTFALPVYKWHDPSQVYEDMVDWVNHADSSTTVFLFAYSLGKAQRVLREIAEYDVAKEITVHGSVKEMNDAYRSIGVDIPEYDKADLRTNEYHGDVVIAPPGVRESTKVQRLSDKQSALISGWMRVRGNQRWRSYDNGFPVSDHCDWEGLLKSVEDASPEQVKTLHGYSEDFAEYLRGEGVDAESWDV